MLQKIKNVLLQRHMKQMGFLLDQLTFIQVEWGNECECVLYNVLWWLVAFG